MRVVSCVLCISALAACATAPTVDREQPIANGVEVARSIVVCRTKVAALEAQLGTPSRDGMLGNARVVTWIVEWDPLVKYLGVLVDASGTVVDLYWNLPSEIQWKPANRCSAAD